ncbi:CapA family protein [Roseomonas hellenica]|uniref:CapA family protein n=1 Tax=Plastoroseomonas hellenica TaxID=2687306 RepID=A0ABS5EZT8_9PROT|nr:CapA family protein [Plastoroseomonas hellenica]MBR0665806.1 CapA family protein [Plastoroseomonas hellenica]
MSTSPFRLALTGDSILQRRLRSRVDPELTPLFDLIRGADLAFTNLEVVPNDYRGDPALESGGSHFGAPAWVLDELTEAGFSLFATATNHCLDYGISGLRAGIDALERRGLTYAGIGPNLEDARRPAYHTHPGATVALLSCSSTFAKGQEAGAQRADMPGRPGLNPLRYDTMHEVTPAQLEQLRAIAEQLGLERQRREIIKLGFGFPPADPEVLPIGAMNFRPAEKTALRTSAKATDVEDIARWVREARLSADIVLVSLHAHEAGASKEEPAEFIAPFARRMIEEGADLVVGHGPHLLRGMEIHKGKPIFYSLGNFIGQNELVPRIPADSYERFRASPMMTPGQVYRQRTAGDTKGFPADRRFWESVMPVCRFDGADLVGMEIHPVSLGLGEAAHRRGRPRLAAGEEGAGILQRFAALSEPFGTRLRIDGDRGWLDIGG